MRRSKKIERIKIVVIKEEDVGYYVIVPTLPGCYSQGDTIEDAIRNGKEAIQCYLESLQKDGLELPRASEELVCDIEVSV